MTFEPVQASAPGHTGEPPPRRSEPPATPPPSGRLRPRLPWILQPPSDNPGGEPRYTLAEARRLLSERECRDDGHDLDCQRWADGSTVLVFCSRCGATFEPPVLPPLPPESELRQDFFRSDGGRTLRLTHIATGLTATVEGDDAVVQRRRADLLLRARLLVAQLEWEATGSAPQSRRMTKPAPPDPDWLNPTPGWKVGVPACVHGWSPLGACSICTPPVASDGRDVAVHVYVLGFSPTNDTLWGVYTTREAAEAASVTLGREHAERGAAGWIVEVPLRADGSIPDEPFVG